jgi:hypothetical protein
LGFKAPNHGRYKWATIKGGCAYAYHWILGIAIAIAIAIAIRAGIFAAVIFIFSHNNTLTRIVFK